VSAFGVNLNIERDAESGVVVVVVTLAVVVVV
jgi:hypothetical protein